MNKSKTLTIGLLVMTIILMMAIFYIGYILTNTSDKTITISPRTTKAQSVAYNKLITLNTSSEANAAGPISTITPIADTPIQISPTGQLLAENINQSPTLTISPDTPAPTENNIVSSSPTASASAGPITKLPQTGYLANVIVMFSVAGLMIFFSFLY